MRELVSREVHKYHDEEKHPYDFRGLKQHIAYCQSVFADDNSVALVTSNKYTGMNKAGKRWFRWENATNISLVRHPNTGHVFSRSSSGRGRLRRHLTNFGTTNIFLYEPAREAIKERFGFEVWHDAYPLTGDGRAISTGPLLAGPESIATNLWLPLQKNDVFEMTTFAFGKTRYRKDLVKAVAQADPNAIAIAIDFRGMVPTDWIINFLRNNPRNEQRGAPPVSVPSIRQYLFPLEPRSLRRLLQTEVGPNQAGSLYGISDAVRSPRTRPQPGFVRNWGEFHDNIYGIRRGDNRWQARNLGEDQRYVGDIKVVTKAEPLDNLQIGTMTVVLPGHTDMLRVWGSEMRNCIGSYSAHALGGHSILGGIYEGDKLIANFEIKKDGTLKQLLGKCNQPMPKDKRAAVVDKFNELGYTCKAFWGDDNGMNNNWF
jgi:hypothetical protein